ncbi:hypothetical protein [Paraburkholderia sp. J94]|uniref:hypothetical protein n=1 Tax=Paraburkholderia sp. J94 TaxID=2805441 RepID=UPI002AB2B7DC|nr:hypothetical protein [Paraburkholderia sp. J94]
MAIFLEFSGEDVMNPDAAVEAMEQIADVLRAMSDAEKASVAACMSNLASSYGERGDFVADLPANLGIV